MPFIVPGSRTAALPLMQAGPPEEVQADERAAYDEAVKAEGEMPAGATLYDDEQPFVEKPPISNEMRAKLLKGQRAMGSDPNSKNPFLYVSAHQIDLFRTHSTVSLSLRTKADPSRHRSAAVSPPPTTHPPTHTIMQVFAGVGVFVILGALAINM